MSSKYPLKFVVFVFFIVNIHSLNNDTSSYCSKVLQFTMTLTKAPPPTSQIKAPLEYRASERLEAPLELRPLFNPVVESFDQPHHSFVCIPGKIFHPCSH